MQRLKRMLRHGLSSDWQRRRLFSTEVLTAIEQATKACESRHAGEIRFAVETALPFSALWQGRSARERAIEIFAREHLWDTEHNNGVLIYVLLAEHDVEIIADRGVGNARVAQVEWERCCQVMEAHFRQGAFQAGAIAGIEAVAEVLHRHPPAQLDAGNELPDRPILL
ncbi:MAG: TPM domain-containing protein [Pseudomonadota bacterium]